jgi:hypothetical protein
MNLPHITSRVNGMKIPLQRGQVGIMHRFTQPENKLLISKVDEQGYKVEENERMVIGSDTTDSGQIIPPAAAPEANLALEEAQSAARAAEKELAELRAQLAQAQAAQAVPKATRAKAVPAALQNLDAPTAQTEPTPVAVAQPVQMDAPTL